MITFPYAVKYNGVIYPANTPIKEVKPEPLEEGSEENLEGQENEQNENADKPKGKRDSKKGDV